MATSYTHSITEGVSFKDFVLKCATTFFYDLGKLEEQTLDQFYYNNLASAKGRLEKLEAMTKDEIATAAEAAYIHRITLWDTVNVDRKKVKVKYQAMLNQVKAWTPPTFSHEPLKTFMIDQIVATIKHDCVSDGTYTSNKKPRPSTWYKEELATARKALLRAQKTLQEQVKLVAKNNAWIKALKECL